MGDKAVMSARFVKEYSFMFNPKWRLRADKFSLGLAMGNPDQEDLWVPYYGRIFHEWANEYIYDDEDRLEILEECFSAKNCRNT